MEMDAKVEGWRYAHDGALRFVETVYLPIWFQNESQVSGSSVEMWIYFEWFL